MSTAFLTPVVGPTNLVAPPTPLCVPLSRSLGVVKFFDPKKQFGFLATSLGDVFFHANGFMVPYPELSTHTVAFTKGVKYKQHLTEELSPKQGDSVQLLVEHKPKGPMAVEWCTVDSFLEVSAQVREHHESLCLAINSLPFYRVTKHWSSYGPSHADNARKCFVRTRYDHNIVIFEGNNTQVLKKRLVAANRYKLPNMQFTVEQSGPDDVTNYQPSSLPSEPMPQIILNWLDM